MLAEGAHSIGDTLNEVFLLASVRRSERPPDRRHPFGDGNERYVWSLLAAFGIFIAGAGFSISYGILTMLGHGGDGTSARLAYAVLALAAVLEGTSWLRALYQARKETRESRRGIVDDVRRSPDVTFKAALFEDSAAMLGLVLAAAGLILREATGSDFWDGLASVLIGVLLAGLAFAIGRESAVLLIGRAADPATQREIRAEILGAPGRDRPRRAAHHAFRPRAAPRRREGPLRRRHQRRRGRGHRRRDRPQAQGAAPGRPARLPRPHPAHDPPRRTGVTKNSPG